MAGVHWSTDLAEKVSWHCALFLANMLVLSCCESTNDSIDDQKSEIAMTQGMKEMDVKMLNRPCDEIYVVREGETLQTITDKCGDPYIVEENPHIHDPDDVFPGLVIKITPFKNM